MKELEQSSGVINNELARMSEFARIEDTAGKDISLVVENVLVSIVGGMSTKNKEIVLDAVQYATTKAGLARKNVQWYEDFIREMHTCGFLSSSFRYGNYEASRSVLTMDEIGLEIIKGLIGGAVAGTLTQNLLKGIVGNAFASLKSQDKPKEIFQRSTKRFDDVSFAIVSGVEKPDGDVLLAMAFISLKVSVTATNVLFWDFNTSSLTIERGENVTILNPRQWRRVQPLIDRYLTDQLEAEFALIK